MESNTKIQPVKVRNLILGQGRPKICVPIVGKTEGEVLQSAAALSQRPADLAEWRIDWFDLVLDRQALRQTMEKLRQALGDMPLLVTFRTAREGGEKDIAPADYVALNREISQWGLADLIDAELFTGEAELKEILEAAHKNGVLVVASSHDFDQTPPKAELVSRLCRMQELGADIPKLAVMPRSAADVLTLLSATEEMAFHKADRPIITMSMKGMGLISRLAGEVFGSAVTFGAAGKTSAPGQIDAGQLAETLELLHSNLM